MAQALKPYIQRAPRYAMSPDDRRTVRFCQVGSKDRSTSTILIDISKSGMAFICDAKESPTVGDQLMVEFTVPGSQQMACYAQVMRIEYRNDDEIMIAVKFLSLMNAHIENLNSGLKKKFKELKSMRAREKVLDKMEWAQSSFQLYAKWGLSAAFIILTFYIIIAGRS